MKKFAKILCWQTEMQNVLCILDLCELTIYEDACQMAVCANEYAALIFPR